jgi:hypothetical protein
MAPTLAKVTVAAGTEPEASNEPPERPIENNLSVLTAVEPTNFKVPPFRMRLEALFADAPMPLMLPPLASEVTDNTPLFMMVAPV